MKLYYYADTDSLYIDHASRQLDLPKLEAGSVPFEAVLETGN